MSQRRSNRSQNDSTSVPESAIEECVHFLLSRDNSKIPIKRAEIIKHLSTTQQIAANQVNAVILEANKVLKQVYGYKLLQVEAKSGVTYIIVLVEDCESQLSVHIDVNHRRILVAALVHIFMTGAPVTEDDMWKFLAEAALLKENDHAGRKLLTNVFTKQMYLSYSKVDGDIPRNVFDWGQRATEEFPKMFTLNKVAEAFQKPPDFWAEQFKIASEGSNQVANQSH